MNGIIKFENGELTQEAIVYLATRENAMKRAKEEYEQMKADLLEAMEQNSILKIDNDILTVTYYAPREDERFDSKALKEASPDLYNEFVKFSPVKASVRIKVK